MADEENNTNLSRRRFMKNSGYVAGGLVGGGLLGSLLGVNWDGSEQATTTPSEQGHGDSPSVPSPFTVYSLLLLILQRCRLLA